MHNLHFALSARDEVQPEVQATLKQRLAHWSVWLSLRFFTSKLAIGGVSSPAATSPSGVLPHKGSPLQPSPSTFSFLLVLTAWILDTPWTSQISCTLWKQNHLHARKAPKSHVEALGAPVKMKFTEYIWRKEAHYQRQWRFLRGTLALKHGICVLFPVKFPENLLQPAFLAPKAMFETYWFDYSTRTWRTKLKEWKFEKYLTDKEKIMGAVTTKKKGLETNGSVILHEKRSISPLRPASKKKRKNERVVEATLQNRGMNILWENPFLVLTYNTQQHHRIWHTNLHYQRKKVTL